MQKIREILLNEYIGAIAIGLLLAQALGLGVSIIIRPITFYLETNNRPRGVFSPAESTNFLWGSLVSPTINLVLYLLIIFVLMHWLYLKQTPKDLPAEDAPEGSEQP